MDAFNYLSVLISLIIGLAITQVLKGYRGILQARHHVETYWPSLLWSVLTIIIAVQTWWSMYGLRRYQTWTFIAFLAVLTQTIVLYLIAALVLPDFYGAAKVSLRDYYYQQRRWFFTLWVLLIASSLARQLILDSGLPRLPELAFHALFATLGVIGIASARERVHESLAVIGALSIGTYIALLFTQLK